MLKACFDILKTSVHEVGVHDLVLVPEDAVAVEISSGVEPEVDPLLPRSHAVGKHVRLQHVGLA